MFVFFFASTRQRATRCMPTPADANMEIRPGSGLTCHHRFYFTGPDTVPFELVPHGGTVPKFNKSYQEQNHHRQNTLVHRAAGAEMFLSLHFSPTPTCLTSQHSLQYPPRSLGPQCTATILGRFLYDVHASLFSSASEGETRV